MSPEATAAIIAAVVSTLGVVGSVLVQLLLQNRERTHEVHMTERSRAREAERLRSRYRDPLLISAHSLQSRIYNIVGKKMFAQPAENESRDGRRSYAVESTLYVLAEFLGWTEILRREMQFLDLGDNKTTRRMNILLYGIRDIVAQNDPRLGRAFRVFRIEQRAIGEVMSEALVAGGESRLQCVGPAQFSERLEIPSFARWLKPVEDGLVELSERHPGALARLALIQNWVLELVDLLDPDAIRVSGSRKRLAVPTELEHLMPVKRSIELLLASK